MSLLILITAYGYCLIYYFIERLEFSCEIYLQNCFIIENNMLLLSVYYFKKKNGLKLDYQGPLSLSSKDNKEVMIQSKIKIKRAQICEHTIQIQEFLLA